MTQHGTRVPGEFCTPCVAVLGAISWQSCSYLIHTSPSSSCTTKSNMWVCPGFKGMALASQSMLGWDFPPKGTQIPLEASHPVSVLNKRFRPWGSTEVQYY